MIQKESIFYLGAIKSERVKFCSFRLCRVAFILSFVCNFKECFRGLFIQCCIWLPWLSFIQSVTTVKKVPMSTPLRVPKYIFSNLFYFFSERYRSQNVVIIFYVSYFIKGKQSHIIVWGSKLLNSSFKVSISLLENATDILL